MCALITDVTGKVKYIQNMGSFPPKNVFGPPALPPMHPFFLGVSHSWGLSLQWFSSSLSYLC